VDKHSLGRGRLAWWLDKSVMAVSALVACHRFASGAQCYCRAVQCRITAEACSAFPVASRICYCSASYLGLDHRLRLCRPTSMCRCRSYWEPYRSCQMIWKPSSRQAAGSRGLQDCFARRRVSRTGKRPRPEKLQKVSSRNSFHREVKEKRRESAYVPRPHRNTGGVLRLTPAR
jgi:hypothetical protein